jgi:hypothetical protein
MRHATRVREPPAVTSMNRLPHLVNRTVAHGFVLACLNCGATAASVPPPNTIPCLPTPAAPAPQAACLEPPPPQTTRPEPSLPVASPSVEGSADLAPGEGPASPTKCRGSQGERLARACSVSLSMTTCAWAKAADVGCCTSVCGNNIIRMTASVVENAAQECAARAKLGQTNPVCDLRLPTFTTLARDMMPEYCMRRCRELLSP